MVSLRACGVGPDVISPATVLATMAIVSFVALVPITPGAIGVSEVAYIALLTAAIDPAYTAQVAAAVLLYRVAQWLVPHPARMGAVHHHAPRPRPVRRGRLNFLAPRIE